MKWLPRPSLVAGPVIVALALLALPWSHAQPGPGRSPAADLAPCFRTKVPPHAYDIILGRPTEGSVAASVVSYADAEGYVEWGTEPGHYPQRTPAVRLPAGTPTQFALGGLAPDTQYHYRLCLGSEAAGFAPGDEYSVHTRRPAGSAFACTITADSHLDERTDPALYSNTLRNAVADAPDFHVDLGDTFMCDKVRPLGEPILPMYLAQRYYLSLLCRSAPLFFVTGNHDGETGNEDPEAVELRQQFLPNPAAESLDCAEALPRRGNYYAWGWGDALFIVLDPFTYSAPRARNDAGNWHWTLGEAQCRWLQDVLAGSRARLKFVFIHHLVGGLDRNARGGAEAALYFEWGGRGVDGSPQFDAWRPGWGLPIHQLLLKYGVSAVFHGHDHLYAHQELDGMTYQQVPQPGWVGGERVNEAANYGYRSGVVLPSSGHLRVQVSPEGATVSYVRPRLAGGPGSRLVNGMVADTFAITPREP